MADTPLVHVGTTEALAARLFEGEEPPTWHQPDEEQLGQLSVRRWGDDHLMVQLMASATGEQHAVRVTVGGLYKVTDPRAVQSESDLDAFAKSQVMDLLPFLRQAVYSASSTVWPVRPIMIDLQASAQEFARQA